MSPQSIVCTACDATVPYGRLSCPACGELLASVAGAARPAKPRAATSRAARGRAAERAAPAVLVDVRPPSPVSAPPEAADSAPEQPAATLGPAGLAPQDAAATYEATRIATLGWGPPGWDTTEPDADWSSDEDREAPVEGSQAPASRLAAPGWEPPIFQTISDPADDDAAVDVEAPADVAAVPTNGAVDDPAARGFSTVAWPADQAPPVPTPKVARPSAPLPFVPDAPGAYVPPIVHAEPAGPPAPARSWAGQPATNPDAEKAGASRSSMEGDLLDATRVTEFVGWLAVAGSAMAAVGFLLPWGVSVIGASGIGYFDRWGLAGPLHLIVFASLLALLGLSLLRNPIPLWLRVGVLGLGLGALLLGLTWPYLVGLSGTGPGAMVVAVGALVLGAAGVVALASDRHAPEDRAV